MDDQMEIGKDETGQPYAISAEDEDRLIDHWSDCPEKYDVARDMLLVLAKHGFVRAQGTYSKPLTDLIADMLGETYSPSTQKWIAEHDSNS